MMASVKNNSVVYHAFDNIRKGIKCVYRLDFTGGYFYVGCTSCLSRRVKNHIGFIKKKKYNKVDLSKEKLLSVTIVFEGEDMSKLKEFEGGLIKSYHNNSMIVNKLRYDHNMVVSDNVLVGLMANYGKVSRVAAIIGQRATSISIWLAKLRVKYDCKNTCQLVAYFFRNGLID